jgi:hypothetical protein
VFDDATDGGAIGGGQLAAQGMDEQLLHEAERELWLVMKERMLQMVTSLYARPFNSPLESTGRALLLTVG